MADSLPEAPRTSKPPEPEDMDSEECSEAGKGSLKYYN